MDIQKLLKQAQKMQGDVKKAEADLAQREYTAKSSGGAVVVVMNGKYEVISIEIEEDLVDKENKEMLSEMIIIAMNQASAMVREDSAAVMGQLTGGISIPGF